MIFPTPVWITEELQYLSWLLLHLEIPSISLAPSFLKLYLKETAPHLINVYEPIEGLGVLKEPLARRLPLSGVNKRGQSKKRGVALA